ncbi:MAG: hypothetical protein RJA89_229, partial [Pseudomonadota bacterium]
GSGDCGIAIFCTAVSGDTVGVVVCDITDYLWVGVYCQLGNLSLNYLVA